MFVFCFIEIVQGSLVVRNMEAFTLTCKSSKLRVFFSLNKLFPNSNYQQNVETQTCVQVCVFELLLILFGVKKCLNTVGNSYLTLLTYITLAAH